MPTDEVTGLVSSSDVSPGYEQAEGMVNAMQVSTSLTEPRAEISRNG